MTSIKISNNLHKSILSATTPTNPASTLTNGSNGTVASQVTTSNVNMETFSSSSSTSSSSSSSSSSTCGGSNQMISSMDHHKAAKMGKPPVAFHHHSHHNHHLNHLNHSDLDSSIQLHNLSQQPAKALTRFLLNSTAASVSSSDASFFNGNNSTITNVTSTQAANNMPVSMLLNDINLTNSASALSIDSTLRLERNYSYVEAMKDDTIVGVVAGSLVDAHLSSACNHQANILDSIEQQNGEFIGFSSKLGGVGASSSFSRPKVAVAQQAVPAWVSLCLFCLFCLLIWSFA